MPNGHLTPWSWRPAPEPGVGCRPRTASGHGPATADLGDDATADRPSGLCHVDVNAVRSPHGWAQLGPDGVVALSGDWSSNDPTDTSAGSLSAAVDYAESLMPVLDPATAKPQEMLVAPVTVPDGKPFAISTVGPVTLVEGNQLFKFAPLLGRMLADAVEGLPLPEVPTFESVGAA